MVMENRRPEEENIIKDTRNKNKITLQLKI